MKILNNGTSYNAYRITTQARWIYILAIVLVGAISKLFQTANVNFSPLLMLALLLIALSYNLLPGWYLRFKKNKRNQAFIGNLTFFQIMADIFIVTAIIHFAGGIESISFIFYFFIIVSAGFIYEKWGVYFVCLISILLYNLLIFSEFYGFIRHISRYTFSDSGLFINQDIVIVNSLAVSLAILASGFFIGYLSSLRIELERETEKEKRLRIKEQEKIEEIRSKFITVITHQFRTPLNHIKLALEGLAENNDGQSAGQMPLIKAGMESLERLLGLLDRLIKIQDLEKGKYSIRREDVRINEVLEKSLEMLRFHSANNSVSVNISPVNFPAIHIKGDPLLIGSVIETLIENAIDYSQKPSKIEVSLRNEGKYALIGIKDHGLSISADDRKKIFNKFFRTDNALRTITDKSGLSLYLAKLIVEKHKGKIWFESYPEGNTEFFVKLPLVEQKNAD